MYHVSSMVGFFKKCVAKVCSRLGNLKNIKTYEKVKRNPKGYLLSLKKRFINYKTDELSIF